MDLNELLEIAKETFGNNSTEANGLQEQFAKINDLISSKIIHNDYELNDTEILSLIVLYNQFNIIQKPAFNNSLSNKCNSILINSLDSALLKIPRTSHKILYRQDNYHTQEPYIGENLTFKGFFTASKDDFDNTLHIKWIITPLSNKLTKAHNIYLVYNYGYNTSYPEWQVEFERNSTFYVTKVIKKKNYIEVYIAETSDKNITL